MSKTLFAFSENKKIGTLTKDQDDTYSFAYTDTWLSDEDSFAISFSLPLEKKKFGHRATLSFFENLLPEGESRQDLERSQNVHGVFEFLEHFGKDCAGAITMESGDMSKPHVEQAPHEVKLESIYNALDRGMPVVDLIAQEDSGYLSLAGAQDKFTCLYKDGHLFLPRNGSPTSHIVKMPIWRYGIKESVYNEYACMELAREVGLEVPHCFIIEGQHPLYAIERYDRQTNATGLIKRIHQQDFCQAQGFPSGEKYETKGGPTLIHNYMFIRDHISPMHRFNSLKSFLQWVSFNLIIGNNDSHSKNISILMEQKNKYRLAPFYDLISTAVYPELKRSFSFKIGDRNEFSKIGKNQIQQLEEGLVLKEGVFREHLQTIAFAIEERFPELRQTLRQRWPNVKIFDHLQKKTQERLKSLRFQDAIGK